MLSKGSGVAVAAVAFTGYLWATGRLNAAITAIKDPGRVNALEVIPSMAGGAGAAVGPLAPAPVTGAVPRTPNLPTFGTPPFVPPTAPVPKPAGRVRGRLLPPDHDASRAIDFDLEPGQYCFVWILGSLIGLGWGHLEAARQASALCSGGGS